MGMHLPQSLVFLLDALNQAVVDKFLYEKAHVWSKSKRKSINEYRSIPFICGMTDNLTDQFSSKVLTINTDSKCIGCSYVGLGSSWISDISEFCSWQSTVQCRTTILEPQPKSLPYFSLWWSFFFWNSPKVYIWLNSCRSYSNSQDGGGVRSQWLTMAWLLTLLWARQVCGTDIPLFVQSDSASLFKEGDSLVDCVSLAFTFIS